MLRLPALVFLTFVLAAPSASARTVQEFCTAFETTAAKGKTDDAAHARAQCIEIINSGVNQNRFSFHPAQAEACLAAAKLSQPLTPCQDVLVGLLAAGQSCESNADCRRPSICAGGHAAHKGKCAAPLALGAPCDDEVLSSSHFFAAAKRPRCVAGTHCAIGQAQFCTKD